MLRLVLLVLYLIASSSITLQIKQGNQLDSPGSNPAGGGYDPNGAPTSNAGAGYDPDGARSDYGGGYDPNGVS